VINTIYILDAVRFSLIGLVLGYLLWGIVEGIHDALHS
jgi:hypothetical protein